MPKKNGPISGQKIPWHKRRAFIRPDTARVRADQVAPPHEKCPVVGIAAPAEGTESPNSIEEGYHLLQAILQSTSDGILAVNEDNDVIFANERFARMLRIPQEIMASKDDNLLLQFVLDQLSDPRNFLQKVQELYRWSEENFDTLYFKDGRVFERRTSSILQGTKVQGRVWSFQEITERQRVEEALVKEQHEMQTIMNYLPVNIYFKDRASRFTRISMSHALRFGLSDPVQAIGKTDFDFFSMEHAQQAYKDEQEIIQTGQTLMKEEKETWTDRPNLWVSTIKMPMRDANENIIGTFGLSTDITERKRIEEALAASEAELRALFASMQDAVIVIDREGVYRKIAPTNPSLLVKPPQELLGKNLKDVFSAEKAEASRQIVQQVLDTKQNAQIEYELIINGRTIWFQTNISPLDADSTLWVAHDINARKQAEEELRRTKEDREAALLKLQQSLEREKQLANTDGLTGLCNHRHFFELAAREFQAALRYQHPLSFVMFDLDNFKQVNDTLGHAAGDKLLAKVAQVAAAQVRASDLVARYGGDEFIIALPYTSAQQARGVTERIQKSVASIPVDMFRSDHEPFAITLSIGIAEIRRQTTDDNVDRIIQRADDALYEAKRSGRNRAVILKQDEL